MADSINISFNMQMQSKKERTEAAVYFYEKSL
jgi:hypothetical protein